MCSKLSNLFYFYHINKNISTSELLKNNLIFLINHTKTIQLTMTKKKKKKTQLQVHILFVKFITKIFSGCS